MYISYMYILCILYIYECVTALLSVYVCAARPCLSWWRCSLTFTHMLVWKSASVFVFV